MMSSRDRGLTEKPLSSRLLLRPLLLRRDASWYARGRNLYDGTSQAASAISETISLSPPRLNHMRLSLKMTGKSCRPPASKHLHAGSSLQLLLRDVCCKQARRRSYGLQT